jgi:threonine aldolase
LLCLENTHNRGGGRAISAAHTDALASVAHRHGVAVHLDGSRLFNAAVALATPVAALAAEADSVGICFSKGLGAPVGSAVAGSHAFIERARKLRRLAGGGMRQAGIIAAAALVALRDGPQRLHEDHANAKLLAGVLAQSDEFDIDVSSVMTNIVIFNLARGSPTDPAALSAAWRDQGVLAHHIGRGRFRSVTHLDVTSADVEAAAAIMVDVAAKQRKQAVLA